LDAFHAVSGNHSLTRVHLSFGAAWAAEWAATVALAVVAFRSGGAGAVGVVAALRLLPGAFLAPSLSAFADRMRRERVLIWGCCGQAIATGAAALVLAVGGPIPFVYALAVLSTVAVMPCRAAHSALLPSLCRTTQELTSSTVVRSLLESVAIVVGPLAVALSIAYSAVWVAFVGSASAAAVAGLLVVGLRYEAPPRLAVRARPHLVRETVEGVRIAAADTDIASVLGVGAVQTFLRGSLTVFTAVMAIELLDMGESGVGVLTGAIGLGSMLGSVAGCRLIGTQRLARWLGLAVAFWGLPLCVASVVPAKVVALLALGVIGVANAITNVTFFTVVARLTPDATLARIYGLDESLTATAVILGSLAAPLAVHLVGVRGALGLIGAAGPLAVLLAWRRLRRTDQTLGAREDIIVRLRCTSVMRPLPVATLEHLARTLEIRTVAPGEHIVREGTAGQEYFIIEAGEVQISQRGVPLGRMSQGDAFGEISLLRNVARTASACASTQLRLLVIHRDVFIPIVGAFTSSTLAGATVVERWLSSNRANPALR
jgi:MFS family permease